MISDQFRYRKTIESLFLKKIFQKIYRINSQEINQLMLNRFFIHEKNGKKISGIFWQEKNSYYLCTRF
ncbi:MAG: hypothetical protein PWQ81_708 [Bacteroidota bacterium]|jgi:hypothetical protein|nr:hypothetical protein [Bacteroidota bacterium]